MTQQPETEADAPTRPALIEPEICPNALTGRLARFPQFASPLRGMDASCKIEALPDCELTPEGDSRAVATGRGVVKVMLTGRRMS